MTVTATLTAPQDEYKDNSRLVNVANRTIRDTDGVELVMQEFEIQAVDPSLPVGFLTATATTWGTGRNNPTTARTLTKEQLDLAITFKFRWQPG